jgi:glutamyl-Q tRNA(Asp) synthetase
VFAILQAIPCNLKLSGRPHDDANCSILDSHQRIKAILALSLGERAWGEGLSVLTVMNSATLNGYRGRYAPSPTGPLHFGSLVAAVAGYLEARSRGGAWLLRIEDLDAPRCVSGAADDILRTLAACGMQWDGKVVYQSARHHAYQTALEQLRALGKVYPCACSRREIADSAINGIDGPVYPGTCRDGLRGKAGRSLRLATRGAVIAFDDALQGRIQQNLETEIGDFILLRADGIYAYQLAVAVDDAAQGITDVVRGADLLDSTPRQIHVLQMLELPVPRYLHVPVAVNAAGEKLSKQTRAAPIAAANPVPALMQALRFLGQDPPRELGTAATGELWRWAIAHWRIERVPRVRQLPAPPVA